MPQQYAIFTTCRLQHNFVCSFTRAPCFAIARPVTSIISKFGGSGFRPHTNQTHDFLLFLRIWKSFHLRALNFSLSAQILGEFNPSCEFATPPRPPLPNFFLEERGIVTLPLSQMYECRPTALVTHQCVTQFGMD